MRSILEGKPLRAVLFVVLVLALPLGAAPAGSWAAFEEAMARVEAAEVALNAAQASHPDSQDAWKASDLAARQAYAELHRAFQAFVVAHPGDARGVQALERALRRLLFVPVPVEDVRVLRSALPALPPELAEGLEYLAAARQQALVKELLKSEPAAAMAMHGAWIDELIGLLPDGRMVGNLATAFLRTYERHDIEGAAKNARRLASSVNPGVRTAAAAWLGTHELRTQPVEMQFTAVDGRAVDLAKLRGKVVVVEFTGVTWCSYCRIAEVQLRDLYARYREQGLEIVAISMEFNPALKGKVLQLLKERNLTWPYYFDGLSTKNPFVERYQILNFPTSMVFDRRGHLSVFNPESAELEAVIRAELAKPAAALTASTADEDWQAYDAVLNAPPPQLPRRQTLLENRQWLEQRGRTLRELGLAFIARHPSDPRRWRIILGFQPDSPRFIEAWGPLDEHGAPTQPVINAAAAAAWKTQVEELRAGLATATDLPPDVIERWKLEQLTHHLLAALEAQNRREPVDLPGLRARVLAYAAAYPDSQNLRFCLHYYFVLAGAMRPDHLPAEWELFAASPNGDITRLAKEKMNFYALAGKPVELAFIAVDGRQVDLARLRGKVVLIDFWATWCAPCVAKLPEVRKLYEAYHAHGFEVIGVSLDRSGDRGKLMDFISQHQLPWPQFHDEVNQQNPAAKRFAVSSIPAVFLLDQDGNVVSTSARGETLEKEVKRLLKL